MLKCRYCPEDANEGLCIGCRSKFEALEAENVRLKKDIAYLRQLSAVHRGETRNEVARKMSEINQKNQKNQKNRKK